MRIGILRHLLQTIQTHLGQVPSCEWVRERLDAYYDFDLPKNEFRAIERHIHSCDSCAKEWRQAKHCGDLLSEAVLVAHGFEDSSEERVANIMARIDAYEDEQAANRRISKPVWMRRWVAQAAVVCLLLICVPALAIICDYVWETVFSQSEEQFPQAATPLDCHYSSTKEMASHRTNTRIREAELAQSLGLSRVTFASMRSSIWKTGLQN